jgi:hypothetical protein
MKIHSLIGHKVTAHHPRGGHIVGVVLKVEREEGRGQVGTLDTGHSISVRDVISKEDIPASYATTYCNRGHSMATGRPIGHECYHIPPAALRLERHGLYAEAIELMQKAKAGAPR